MSVQPALLCLAFLAGTALPQAEAGPLLERDWLTPGDGLLTLGPAAGREWLDLTQSVDLSFNVLTGSGNNCNPTCTEGLFQGFTFATQADAEELIANAGITIGQVYFDIPTPESMAILDLINLTGPTVVETYPTTGGEDRRVAGLVHVGPFDPLVTIYGTHITEGAPFQAQAQTGFSPHSSPDSSSPDLGAWLPAGTGRPRAVRRCDCRRRAVLACPPQTQRTPGAVLSLLHRASEGPGERGRRPIIQRSLRGRRVAGSFGGGGTQ